MQMLKDNIHSKSRPRHGPCIFGCNATSLRDNRYRPRWNCSNPCWDDIPHGSTMCQKCYVKRTKADKTKGDESENKPRRGRPPKIRKFDVEDYPRGEPQTSRDDIKDVHTKEEGASGGKMQDQQGPNWKARKRGRPPKNQTHGEKGEEEEGARRNAKRRRRNNEEGEDKEEKDIEDVDRRHGDSVQDEGKGDSEEKNEEQQNQPHGSHTRGKKQAESADRRSKAILAENLLLQSKA